MESLINLFNIVLYQPLFNALVFLYQYLPGRDFGIAVILLTVLIRLVLYPSMAKALKSQKVMAELQPKIKRIQEEFKNDREKQARETMALYQKEKINPMGGCLPLLVQLPILIALYRVFWKGFEASELNSLYSFIPRPEQIDPHFLGFINLAAPSLVLAVLAGVGQFLQTRYQNKLSPQPTGKGSADQFSSIMQKQMTYFFPVFTVFILWKLPAAIGLYWITTSLFSVFQQYLIFKSKKTNAQP
ncbi:MAG: membrane protein insertase YidC [Candidatus Nealsonbacteria bacterium]|nr:membrane protein insertase YidC [Candidatus Nealsonbacteria bacterium]